MPDDRQREFEEKTLELLERSIERNEEFARRLELFKERYYRDIGRMSDRLTKIEVRAGILATGLSVAIGAALNYVAKQ